MKKKIFRVIAGIFIIMALYFFSEGFDKKDNYNYDENYSILNKNAYVGADAYNFIINGTYFTGYLVIGSAMMISGMISLLISEGSQTQSAVINETSTKVSNEDEVLTKF